MRMMKDFPVSTQNRIKTNVWMKLRDSTKISSKQIAIDVIAIMWKNTSCFKKHLNVLSDHPLFFVLFLFVAIYTERLISTFNVQCTMCGQVFLNFIEIVKCNLGKLNNKKQANRKMSIAQNLQLACNVQHFANVFSLSKKLQFFLYL